MSDSSTGGYLLASSADDYDRALDRALQQAVSGITGLDGALVRPRWQISPATMPEIGADWAAIGVSHVDPDASAYERHVVADDGMGHDVSYSVSERDERMHVLASFYGQRAMALAMAFFDGVQLAQNREALMAGGIDLVSVADVVRAPSLVAMKWQMRVDVAIITCRRAERSFPVRTIAGADGIELDNERYLTNITINP